MVGKKTHCEDLGSVIYNQKGSWAFKIMKRTHDEKGVECCDFACENGQCRSVGLLLLGK